jgi:hypothetical protein
VAIINLEVSAAMIARWAQEHSIDQDRLYLVNLRGRRNPFSHPQDREFLAADLRAHGTESLIVDPFGRAYPGQSQNDAGEIGTFLVGSTSSRAPRSEPKTSCSPRTPDGTGNAPGDHQRSKTGQTSSSP